MAEKGPTQRQAAQSRGLPPPDGNGDANYGAPHGRGPEQYLLLVDGSNREVDDLNRLAQARRLAAGELGGAAVAVDVLDPRRGTLRHEAFHAGDRVLFDRQHRPTDGPRVENGTAGVVAAVDPAAHAVTVRTDDRYVTLRGDELTAVRLGYAQHVYSAQGRTVDRVYVVTGGWQADRASAYVAVSRARDASFVVSDHSSLDVPVGDREAALTELARRTTVEREKVAALTVAGRQDDEVRANEPRPPADRRDFHLAPATTGVLSPPVLLGELVADAVVDRGHPKTPLPRALPDDLLTDALTGTTARRAVGRLTHRRALRHEPPRGGAKESSVAATGLDEDERQTVARATPPSLAPSVEEWVRWEVPTARGVEYDAHRDLGL